jgi:hypothetical protein
MFARRSANFIMCQQPDRRLQQRPNVWLQSTPCVVIMKRLFLQTGGVHVWVPACAGTTGFGAVAKLSARSSERRVASLDRLGPCPVQPLWLSAGTTDERLALSCCPDEDRGPSSSFPCTTKIWSRTKWTVKRARVSGTTVLRLPLSCRVLEIRSASKSEQCYTCIAGSNLEL